MRKLALLLYFFPLAAFAQGPATTTVQGPVYGLDGGLANGTVRIVSPVAFKSTDGFYIAQNTQYLAQIANGALSVALVPNTYDQAGNLLDFYTATYTLTSGTYTEYWIVPATSPVQVPAVISPVLPVPGIQVNVYQLVPPVNCQSLGGFPKFVGFWTCSSGGGAVIQTNGAQNTSQLTLNFQNPASFQGLNFAFSNPSGGVETFSVSGTLNNAGLTNTSTTINSQVCTLGSSCAIPFNTNGLPNTSQVGFNLQSSSAVSGVSVNVTNPSSNNVQLSLSGFPSLTTGGDLIYFNGTVLARVPGNSSGTQCFLENSSGVPSFGACGSPPAGNNGDVQIKNGASLGSGGLNDSGGNITNAEPLLQNANSRFKGPNPYVDGTAYGVRAVNPSAAPAISGVNCTTTAGSPAIILSLASTFQNGDGIVCQNAGAANGLGAMGALTVAPFHDRGGTGTGDGVTALVGGTTYNYIVFGCDVGGGCTAPSSVGSTTTGAASLGSQSQSGYSATRSNDTWTYTVGSTPPFAAGASVTIDTPTAGISDASFEGKYIVNAVSGTGFTVTNAPGDTRQGAIAASAGTFTVHWFNYNKVTWSAVTGTPFRYFACSDRATPGTYHVIGPALLPANPVNTNFNDGSLEFDDFGATMMAQSVNNVPWYVSDANCTGSATNDNWVTTIASGAGTTTLTANGSAPNSNGGPLTIRFDNTPNYIAALTAAGNAPLELPFQTTPNTSYVFNSVVNFGSTGATLLLPAGAFLNDTMILGGNNGVGAKVYGDRIPGRGSAFSFTSQSNPVVSGSAWPLVMVTNANQAVVSGLEFSAPNNGIAFLQDGGGGSLGSTYIDDVFHSGSTSTDYMGIGFVCRGAAGADCRASFKGKVLFSAGTQGMANQSSAPSYFCDGCATAVFDELMGNGRAIVFAGATNNGGGGITIRNIIDWQGGSTPLFTLSPKYGAFATLAVSIGGAIEDTMAQPCITNLAGFGSAVLNGTCIPSSGLPQITGLRLGGGVTGIQPNSQAGQTRDTSTLACGLAYDGVLSGGSAQYCVQQQNTAIQVDTSHPIFIGGTTPSLNSAPVSAGGTLSVGTHPFQIVPVWWNGGQGIVSNTVTATTTSGNQTVTLNWTQVPGNPQSIFIYDNNNRISTTAAGNATSIVLSSESFIGAGTVSIPVGGPTILLPGTQGIATPALILAGSQPLTGVQGTDTNVPTSGIMTGSTGSTICKDANGGITTSGCSSGVGGTVTYTANQTASASDSGKLVLMNCASACAYTLPATQPSSSWFVYVMTIGATNATVALGGADTFNNSTSVPVLIKWQTLPVYANTAIATDYEGSAPLLAGSGISFTPASNSLTLTGTGGGGGVTLQTNGTNNISQTTLNFTNPASFNGLTFTFSNPSSGNETFSLGGTLGNAGLTNSSLTVNGVGISLGGSGTVSGTESTQTGNYTATTTDFQLSRRIVMNCASACTFTLPATAPANGEIGIESIGSIVATVSLNGRTFNGATSIPVLINDRLYVWTTDGTNYFGEAPLVAGTGIAFTASSNGVTIATANIPNSSLQNASTTVNSQTCTLGATCTIPEQVNGVSLTSLAGFNDITSTTNAIGITVTPSNPGTNQIKNELTGVLNPSGGGCGLANPTAHSLFIAEGSSNCSLLTSPSTNGFYVVGFNVTASAAVDPSASLQGVAVNSQSGNYTLAYSDRASELPFTGGSASTFTIPVHTTAGFGSDYPFVVPNTGTATLTLSPTTDTIDGGASQSVFANWTAFVYENAAGNFNSLRMPLFSAFPNCNSAANALTFTTSTGVFGCNSISGGGGLPSIVGTASNVTNQSSSQSSVTIATAPTAGQYEIQYYADLNTTCTTGANAVNFAFNWTDASGTARSLQTGNLSMGSAQAASSYLSGSFFIWVGSGNVTYTSTVVGACSSGTSSYDIHLPGLMRVQ